ncbi:3-oxoacyl-[acyl-carrier-protein] synthase III C-terminal domain-containing protein [Phenylobacterium sp.]|uniref:type III polyketide synthase n=1 Tax=Phenylobacterium sp. TaxID=1871053 RepID=UPI001221D1FD|nr:3-oxoacyl-[acyl-carrier-protein] synthase III C-terminal domain-containing protein [Phenylobacterium sp.]THD56166.1 MAG: type III polyketide synthase [Phenylobacterium sp.]
MTATVKLLSLATATPPHDLAQDDVFEVAHQIFIDRFPEFVRMGPVFDHAGVRHRQIARPVEWYLQPHGWADRAAVYDEVALDLFCRAAEGALAEAGLTGADIDAIVTVSTTGVSTPSLEAKAMTRLGFRSDAARAPLFGVGCAGGATGLALAYRLAKAQPGAKVLLVCVELCSLAFHMEELSKTDIISTAIFGDGAAACVLSSEDGAQGFATVAASAEHTWAGTLGVMGWQVRDAGLGVLLDQALPPFVRREIRPVVEAMLARQGLRLEDVDRFICHPGGMKVIEALEGALGLGQGALDHEREVLADHGNMSSPTVLFILDRARRTGLPKRSVLTAMGPGFTASTVTLEAA